VTTAYRIINWRENFEVSQSLRIVGALSWVGIPTKHDGKSFRRMIRLPNGPALFGCWCLIVQIAAKCPARGTLADADGPLTAEDMEEKSGCPSSLFTETIEVCCSKQIRWMESFSLGDNSENAPYTDRTDRPTEPDRQTDKFPAPEGNGGGKDFESEKKPGKTPANLRALDAMRSNHLMVDAAIEKLHRKLIADAPGHVRDGDDGLLDLLGVCERSMEVGDKPIALFVSTVRDGRWKLVNDQQKARALQRLKEFRRVQKSLGDGT
jgi:hypothetical protein